MRARDILQALTNISKFVEGEEYAQKLIENFGEFVILDGAKDRGIPLNLYTPYSFTFHF